MDIGFLAGSGVPRIWHRAGMAHRFKRRRQLIDSYAFPCFRPRATVRGVFGDPKARVVTLVRRSKKRSAAAAVACTAAGTTGVRVGCAICPVAMPASISSSRSGASTAGAAGL